jgi:hypothetical protein
LDVHDLGELEVGRVGGEQTSSGGAFRLQANLRVDVEVGRLAARRPDNGGAVSLVMLDVVLGHWALKGISSARLVRLLATLYGGGRKIVYLRRKAREVVGRLESTSDTLLDGGVATVIGGQDGVLESSGVLDVKVKLAVLALLGDGDARANGSNVCIVDEGQGATILRDSGCHGTLGAAGTSICDTFDLDLGCVNYHISKDRLETYLTRKRSVTELNGQEGRGRSGERSESKEPLHIDSVDEG